MNRKRNQEQIFAIAAEIQDAELRNAYLADACGGDAELRVAVDKLLQHDCEEDSFLDKPVAAATPTLDLPPITEQVGSQIGPYKLMEQIGEGGMGVVYVAVQQRPVKRKVALKIIKPGMDSKEIIARFEAERQALAMMDHPNIAKVLDAGTTVAGRPYFAMELVKGIPITEYCDRNQLSVRARLELFVQVCQATQHAHQKGIIHRDLKPSNVLVRLHDEVPVPKVIDFGVAKALHHQLTDRTIYTRFAQVIGTPLYMSPEQAELGGVDVDTRTDIYSLGVLLYELLTGVTPFDKQRFSNAAFDEIRQIIREHEPPKPSTRISTLGDSVETISENRRTDRKRLGRALRGELDWIVMKALEKDRNRRYETANALAADVNRYLRDEAVEACPPSAIYRFHKFARRYRGPLVTATAFGVVLLSATVVSTWQARVARDAEQQAFAILRDLQVELEEKVFAAMMAGDEAKAREAIEQAKQAEVPDQTVELFRGQLALYYGRAEEAMETLMPLADKSVAAQGMLATACFYAQDFKTMSIALNHLASQLQQAGGELTFKDKLFAGQAMINSDMVLGVELVRQASQQRSTSPLARMIRAVTLAAYAHNTGKVEELRPALEEIKVAMRWVDGTPCLVSAHHMVLEVAHTFGLGDEAGINIEQLHSDWDRVKDLPAGRMMLIRLLANLRDPDVPRRIKSLSLIPEGEMVFYIPILLNYETPAEVLAFLESYPHELGLREQSVKARIMALLPKRRLEAEELCVDLSHRDQGASTRSFCLNTLLLLGRDQVALQLARDVFDTTTPAPFYRGEIVCFLAGRMGRDDFLAGADVSAKSLEASFTIGMLERANGKWAAALKALRACDETQAIHGPDFWWARAMVNSQQTDSAWTLQIPADKN